MIKRTHEQWRALFAEHVESGLSAAAFCKMRKLCPKYFGLRRKQLFGEDSTLTKASPFIQAKPVASSFPSGHVRLRYRGVELVFDSVRPELIVTVVKQLA